MDKSGNKKVRTAKKSTQPKLFEQVFKVKVNNGFMHPTGGEPYEFTSEQAAKDIVSICYGLDRLGKTITIVEEQK